MNASYRASAAASIVTVCLLEPLTNMGESFVQGFQVDAGQSLKREAITDEPADQARTGQ